MAFTKGELLRHAIAFALRSVRLSGRRLGLTEDDRMRVADDTLRELRRHGEWRELDETVNVCREDRRGPRCHNNIYFSLDELDRDFGQVIGTAFPPPIFNRDGATLDLIFMRPTGQSER
jgi:hypothetical protein